MFNFYEIILLFFIYAFMGWLFEIILTLFEHHKFINRGFLIGPYLPIYGFGGFITTILFSKYTYYSGVVSNELINILTIFAATTLVCSVLEYFTSWAMEKLFNNRWWDYSDLPLNINGRICFFCSLGFGAGCTFCLKVVNPSLRLLMDIINIPTSTLKIIDIILLFIIIMDAATSFKIIRNFKNISNSIIEDSTEKITKMVKEKIQTGRDIFLKRLVNSFPNMRTQNRLSKLRNRILDEQKKIEKTTYKLDLRKREIKKLEKELNKSKRENKSLFRKFKKNKK